MYSHSVLIKPASSLCNLNCTYCFYNDISEKRETKSYGIMSQDVLETIIRKSIEYTEHVCYFMFQGGEPTVAGIGFFKNAIKLQERYNSKNINIVNSIQTNGYDIDDQWISFFKKNNILVGLSLDGPKELHDINRVNFDNKGSHNKVIKTLELLKKNQIEYNILTVINNKNAKYATRLFNFYKKYDINHVQLIPCLDDLDNSQTEESLSPKKYLEFLKIFFDHWYWDLLKGNFMNVRYFNNLLSIILGHNPESCDMSGMCQCQFITEADGSMYPCDFYCTDEHNIGNILDNSFDEIRNNNRVKDFINQSHFMTKECSDCESYLLCRGGCRRHYIKNKEGIYKNIYCDVYKEFLRYASENLKNAAYLLLKRSR